MKKKNMISIFVFILLIAVSISSATGTIDENEIYNMKNDDYNNLIKQVIKSGVISNDDWLQQDKLLTSDGAASDLFGYSVSIDGGYAIVGARFDDDNGEDSGSAYIFTTEEAPVFLLGTITNLNVTENYKTFYANFLLYLCFKPFTFNIYRDYEEIMISNDYFGFVGQGFIIGRFRTLRII